MNHQKAIIVFYKTQAKGITTSASAKPPIGQRCALYFIFVKVSGSLYNHLRNLCAIGAGLGIQLKKKEDHLSQEKKKVGSNNESLS